MNNTKTNSVDIQKNEAQDRGDIFEETQRRITATLIRVGILVVLIIAAWCGVWMSGMSKLWAVVVSMLGAFLALFVGMVLSGVKYHNDISYIVHRFETQRQGFHGQIDDLQKNVDELKRLSSEERKKFGMLAIMMAKEVADGVASRLLARHARNLHIDEQREAAIREAEEIVTEEIIAYGNRIENKLEEEGLTDTSWMS